MSKKQPRWNKYEAEGRSALPSRQKILLLGFTQPTYYLILTQILM